MINCHTVTNIDCDLQKNKTKNNELVNKETSTGINNLKHDSTEKKKKKVHSFAQSQLTNDH